MIGSNTPNPSVVGQQVTITFTVAPSAPGAGTPTGNVTVSDGDGTDCTAAVAVGNCVIVFSTDGLKTLTATYAGDGNFNGSTTPVPTGHTVNLVAGASDLGRSEPPTDSGVPRPSESGGPSPDVTPVTIGRAVTGLATLRNP
jgi:hypothetical protein